MHVDISVPGCTGRGGSQSIHIDIGISVLELLAVTVCILRLVGISVWKLLAVMVGVLRLVLVQEADVADCDGSGAPLGVWLYWAAGCAGLGGCGMRRGVWPARLVADGWPALI